ncbi:aminoacyl-tRNA deacylase [Corticimicrobacter populi]|uniref:Cys-tRNA(Pro)/Cys-tRNA(Cys) deacylase n=1 Tax=Corticimicrobacter populi TaxID=2175229 RepID=A0A2V1K1S1_9BURK|nr:aminoacyl-tRNA deacylase [Corticimicrobacter populi]PWF23175.1 Cys-tRNA(Pro) deacylase [Corticimicrobacter populi]
MSKSAHVSETPATRLLKQQKVAFEEYVYEYVDHGGTSEASRQLGLDPHSVVKTLVMEDERKQPLIILMHGDCEVSTRNLARQVGVKRIEPCAPETAQRHSGYQVGGTSPFATRKRMPVWVESTILDLPGIYINGGRRGYILGMDPAVLRSLLDARPVQVALVD